MAIDVTQPDSPGWWMQKLSSMLAAKQRRLTILNNYAIGRPPLIGGTPNQQTVFWSFQQIARTNFAALIVGARRERLAVRAIRTAVGSGDEGDDDAWRRFQSSGMSAAMPRLAAYVGNFGEGYLATALADDGPRWTAEDPRQTIAYCDPVTGETVAAFKLFHDFLRDTDYAVLWLPGRRWVAFKSRALPTPRQSFAQGPPDLPRMTFSASSFEMLPMRDAIAEVDLVKYPVTSESYEFQGVPIEQALDQDGVGQFELHTDLLDRINHTILQRVVIAVLQAFKQRAIELTEDLPEKDEDGNTIDYNDVFSADPGALWKIPAGAKIWESTEASLDGILGAAKADILMLAAVTRTPLSMFTPDAAAQSAEGASLQREGLVYAVEDMQRILGQCAARSFSNGYAMAGDEQRADLGQLTVEWFPADRYSLAERADADSKSKSLTWEQRQRVIWQMTPTEVAAARIQRQEDADLLNTVVDKSAPNIAEA